MKIEFDLFVVKHTSPTNGNDYFLIFAKEGDSIIVNLNREIISCWNLVSYGQYADCLRDLTGRGIQAELHQLAYEHQRPIYLEEYIADVKEAFLNAVSLTEFMSRIGELIFHAKAPENSVLRDKLSESNMPFTANDSKFHMVLSNDSPTGLDNDFVWFCTYMRDYNTIFTSIPAYTQHALEETCNQQVLHIKAVS